MDSLDLIAYLDRVFVRSGLGELLRCEVSSPLASLTTDSPVSIPSRPGVRSAEL
jgi:hypothetical protein